MVVGFLVGLDIEKWISSKDNLSISFGWKASVKVIQDRWISDDSTHTGV
jgi:hypothetical protein